MCCREEGEFAGHSDFEEYGMALWAVGFWKLDGGDFWLCTVRLVLYEVGWIEALWRIGEGIVILIVELIVDRWGYDGHGEVNG
ncbi:hypothetical protein M0R45_010764 [Rubus argutus]|uniref:NADH dehydrogenase subunit 6 n=1 Tax=Rubus argutus TaxID=59490 RepID=A0AAW1YAI5_RUBAR